MEALNSYYGMAENDYLFAVGSMKTGEFTGNFNVTASLFAQSGEKFLKAVIEKGFPGDQDAVRLLRSHNLRALHNKILTKYEMNADSVECKWLGDFYYDARYPGDDFVLVTEEDALRCKRIVESIRSSVDPILEECERERSRIRQTLENLKAFGVNADE